MNRLGGSKMKRAGRKALSFLLTLCMIISCMDGFSITARADGEWSKFADGVTTLGTSGIGSPKASGTNEDGWAGDYVYYGKYDGTNPTKYRVLDPNSAAFGVMGGSMLLDCDTVLYKAKFHGNSNVWSTSDVKSGLNGNAFLNKANNFTAVEKGAIAASSKSAAATGDKADGNGWEYLNWASLTDDVVFVLDAKEATNASYGYANTSDSEKTRKKSGSGNIWWLRSPSSNRSDLAGYVGSAGDVSYGNVVSKGGVSPAFNINLSSVLFSSVINPESTGSYGKEYKLTLKDGNTTITPGMLTRSGDTVTVPYTITDGNSDDGITADTVSVLILSSSNAVKYYAPLTGTFAMTGGSGTFDIPASFDAENDTVYLLAEDTHEGNNAKYLTDYASEFAPITVPASADSSNFTALQTLIGNTADGGMLQLDKDYVALDTEGRISIPSGKTITVDLNGHTIDRKLTAETYNGNVIYNAGTLTIKDTAGGGKITGGWTDLNGGGIYNEGILNFEGGTVSENTAVYGGGIYNKNGTLNLDGGTISGNKAGRYGGGVYNYGTFTMNGGTVSENHADMDGGGVENNKTFTLNGGAVSGNNADMYGGGVDNNVTFAMYGGKISGNNAIRNGGGVYNNKAFAMSGGTVSENHADMEGGGVYNNDTFTMSGGTITENTAKYDGGGVRTYNNSFSIGSGSTIKIIGNTVSGKENNVDLYSDLPMSVNSAPVSGSQISVHITLAPEVSKPRTITADCKGDISYFFSDGDDYAVIKDGDAAKLVVKPTVTFNANGGTGTMTVQKVAPDTETALTANAFTRKGYEFSKWTTEADGSGTSYADKANVTLTVDATLSLYAQWTLKEIPVRFDANGGSGTMADMSAKIGDTFTFPACSFTAPANKVFSRWELSGDDGIRFPGTTVEIVENHILFDEITVTAKWKPATYTLVPEVPATCTEKGKKAHYKAEDGRLYSKSGDDTYTLIEDESTLDIKALGHSFTYSADGAVITAHCGNVGCTLDDQTATLSLNKTGFSFGDAITPTVTLSDGWTAANGFTTMPTAADVKYVGRDSTTYAESTTAPANAGTYTASLTVGTATASVDFSIEKVNPTYTVPAGLTATYGDKLSDVSLADFAGWSWADGTQSVGNAGTNTFKATYTPADTSNYNVISNIDVTVGVAKKAATVTALSQTVALKGSIVTGTDKASLSGALEGHVLTGITLTADTSAVTTNGSIIPSAAVIKNGSTDVSANYEITYVNGTLTVTQGITEISTIPTATAITYGQALSSSTLSGGVATYAGASVAGTFAWKDGSTKPAVSDSNVTEYEVTFTPDDAVNYSAATCKVKITVNKAAITITADDKSSGYGKDLEELTYKVGGAYKAGDDLGITLSTSAGNAAKVGEYPITVSWNGNGNYSATLKDGKYTITKTALSITATGYTGTYDGNAHGITVSGAPAGTTITYGTSGDAVTQTVCPTFVNAADEAYKVYYKVSGTNFEDVTGSATVKIDRRAVAVSGIRADDKNYDENGNATLDFAYVTFENIAAGDAGKLTVTATGTFEDGQIGKGKTVNITNLVLGGEAASNYVLAVEGQQATARADISRMKIVDSDGGTIETRVKDFLESEIPQMTGLTTGLAQSLCTPAELAAYAAGAKITLDIEISKAGALMTDEVVTLVTNVLKDQKSVKLDGADYLDVTLYLKVGDAAPRKITNLGGKSLSIQMDVPEDMYNHVWENRRTYYIVGVHGGVAKVHAATTDHRVPFDTDEFSVFALCYADENIVTYPATDNTVTTAATIIAPKTYGEDASERMLMLFGGVAAMVALITGIYTFRRRKEEE